MNRVASKAFAPFTVRDDPKVSAFIDLQNQKLWSNQARQSAQLFLNPTKGRKTAAV
jgi:hypothetical protein